MAGPIPKEETDPCRLAIRRTMKQLSGPYKEFEGYYPLEDTIELYMEIWYESSSSDEEWKEQISTFNGLALNLDGFMPII